MYTCIPYIAMCTEKYLKVWCEDPTHARSVLRRDRAISSAISPGGSDPGGSGGFGLSGLDSGPVWNFPLGRQIRACSQLSLRSHPLPLPTWRCWPHSVKIRRECQGGQGQDVRPGRPRGRPASCWSPGRLARIPRTANPSPASPGRRPFTSLSWRNALGPLTLSPPRRPLQAAGCAVWVGSPSCSVLGWGGEQGRT